MSTDSGPIRTSILTLEMRAPAGAVATRLFSLLVGVEVVVGASIARPPQASVGAVHVALAGPPARGEVLPKAAPDRVAAHAVRRPAVVARVGRAQTLPVPLPGVRPLKRGAPGVGGAALAGLVRAAHVVARPNATRGPAATVGVSEVVATDAAGAAAGAEVVILATGGRRAAAIEAARIAAGGHGAGGHAPPEGAAPPVLAPLLPFAAEAPLGPVAARAPEVGAGRAVRGAGATLPDGSRAAFRFSPGTH